MKFALLRRLTEADRKLGLAWYYVPGDDGKPDGRHLEWRDEAAWELLEPVIYLHLRRLSERSIAGLERLDMWPAYTTFHSEPMPPRNERKIWAERKREALHDANIVFLDPDNGLGKETLKHASYDELRLLRRQGRAVVFITFPGRHKPHRALLSDLHYRLREEVGAESIATLRTNISVPAGAGARSYVQRQRWFTVIDTDPVLLGRLQEFADDLAKIPRLKASLDYGA